MALWLVRGGSHGEHEQKFLNESRIYLTWEELNHNLSEVNDKTELRHLLEKVYPEFGSGKTTNHLGQIWAFSHRIEKGDWVVLPSKHKSAIHIAEVLGDYTFHPDGEDPYFHSLAVKWVETDIPRSNFDQDLLFSFGAFMTVCEIKRNDAEKRVRDMKSNGWKPKASVALPHTKTDDTSDDSSGEPQVIEIIEQAARDGIAKFVTAKFSGHGMARLVDAVLCAQGYTTHVSPPGPDKGIDILAAPGPLGFGQPRICVQVKSGDTPLDRPTLDQLIGVMQNVQADQGLLVSWGGFKSSVDKETASQFFRVRLWDQDDLIEQLLSHYERLNEEIQTELPLKRIWTLAEAIAD